MCEHGVPMCIVSYDMVICSYFASFVDIGEVMLRFFHVTMSPSA